MSKRIFLFVVVLIFGLSGEIFSQSNFPLEKRIRFSPDTVCQGVKLPLYQYGLNRVDVSTMQSSNLITTQKENFSIAPKFFISNTIAPSYYVNKLGFFCKKELQIEKATSLPIRFRLGSLAYTDYLEGKPNAIR